MSTIDIRPHMKILDGIRVIDWTVHHAGPSAAVKLGELGAEVIKVEEPSAGDLGRGLLRVRGASTELPGGRNWYFEYLNYNKKGITANLRSEHGKDILYRLVEKSDVFITNFRPRAVSRLGLDYQTLSRYNPRLVYASGSFLGHKGPDADLAGLEDLCQARSGLMSVTGEAHLPPQISTTSVTDQAGALCLAFGVIAALLARERFGIGQEVTTSTLAAALLLQSFTIFSSLFTGKEPNRETRAKARNPVFNNYKCKDGRWIYIGLLEHRYWPPFCKCIGRPDLAENPKFDDAFEREQNAEELVSILDQVFSTKEYTEWEKAFREYDLQFAVVNTTLEVINDPQTSANEYITEVEHSILGKVEWMLLPVHFSKTPVSFTLPAPELGQHTEEVLTEICGYSWEEVRRFRDQGVI